MPLIRCLYTSKSIFVKSSESDTPIIEEQVSAWADEEQENWNQTGFGIFLETYSDIRKTDIFYHLDH